MNTNRIILTAIMIALSVACALAQCGGPEKPVPTLADFISQIASVTATLATKPTAPVSVANGGTGVTSVAPVWTNLTLINSWAWYDNGFSGTASPSYWKDPMGIVHLRGSIKDGTSGTQFATLPAGYRPLKHVSFVVFSGATGFTAGNIQILKTGECYATGATSAIQLEAVSFPGEQ